MLGSCGPCPKNRDQTKHFCISDFVVWCEYVNCIDDESICKLERRPYALMQTRRTVCTYCTDEENRSVHYVSRGDRVHILSDEETVCTYCQPRRPCAHIVSRGDRVHILSDEETCAILSARGARLKISTRKPV
ncbi:hypothetical protein HNY73_001742 [Argiope bruennichi]|uniref:Uncharacterized protein n=1 Tax=Argiope bruennichi TaxID=94029 RepID=A0A8T0FST3_ARGBR|nr:hypothetical protein HNY73_001742 [Argiope bruennichi]